MNSVSLFMENLYICDTLTLIWIFMCIRYIFNKIVNLTKFLFKSNLYNSVVQVGFI